jgi:phage terminase small subunit
MATATLRGNWELTDKQELFAIEYAKDRNATQAAIRAGYSPASARQQGTRLLSYASVRGRVEEILGEVAGEAKLEAKAVLDRLWREALREDASASHSARVRALELLGKHLGILTERVDHTSGGDAVQLVLGNPFASPPPPALEGEPESLSLPN